MVEEWLEKIKSLKGLWLESFDGEIPEDIKSQLEEKGLLEEDEGIFCLTKKAYQEPYT